MTLPNTFGAIATGAQEPGAALDQNFQAVGSSVTIQCTASGTNAITLTEMTNAYQPNAYGNFQLFAFVAPNTSTGSATLSFRALGFLPWYKSGATPAAETQLGTGDVVQNTYYVVAYRGDLNGAAGGFVTVSATAQATSFMTLGTENVMSPLVPSSVSTVAHGLSRIPDFTFAWFQCLTADQGYVTGDRIMAGNQGTSAGISQQQVQADATNTRLILAGAAPSTITKTGGSGGNMTLANWKFVAQPVIFIGNPFT